MSWFSEEHKKLYSSALSALYSDIKNGANSVIDTTKKNLSNGYSYFIKPDSNDISSSSIDIDNTDVDIDENLIELGKSFPDILIKLHKYESNIIKIYIIDDEEFKPVRGKIECYPYISKIIHEWFIYENYKWYPTEDLYTAYRNSSPILDTMDKIIFKYQNQEYKPDHYKNDDNIH